MRQHSRNLKPFVKKKIPEREITERYNQYYKERKIKTRELLNRLSSPINIKNMEFFYNTLDFLNLHEIRIWEESLIGAEPINYYEAEDEEWHCVV